MRPADDQGTPHKKVRLACRRCRAKRIKCDGGIPACSHCAKAAVACVDVDGRNNDRSIPRDYATRCHARIQWLEQQIKALDPDFDLSQGPQLAPSSSDGGHSLTVAESPPVAQPPQSTSAASDSSHPREPQPISTRKRPYAAVQASNSNEVSAPTPAAEARSVAVDLGMLSLHSDSRQKHYLGSSSGLFFTNLIGAQANALASPVSTLAGPYQSNRKSSHPPVDAYHLLHRTLSAELPSPEEATTLLDVYLQEIH